jgi:hypothetical protein
MATVDKARADLVEHEAVLARWEAEQAATAAERADLEKRAGDEVLADPAAAARIADDLARLAGRADVAARAVLAARARVAACRPPLLVAQAEALRAEAATLRAQAAARAKRTVNLLAELDSHEGVPYGPAPLPSVDGVARMPMYPRTRTQGLQARADVLDAQAAELEQVAAGGGEQQQAARVAALVAG